MIEKFSYIRSKALLKACREIPCQNCGRDDGEFKFKPMNSMVICY